MVEPTIYIEREYTFTLKVPNKICRFQVVPMTRKINAKTELPLVSIKWRLLVFD